MCNYHDYSVVVNSVVRLYFLEWRLGELLRFFRVEFPRLTEHLPRWTLTHFFWEKIRDVLDENNLSCRGCCINGSLRNSKIGSVSREISCTRSSTSKYHINLNFNIYSTLYKNRWCYFVVLYVTSPDKIQILVVSFKQYIFYYLKLFSKLYFSGTYKIYKRFLSHTSVLSIYRVYTQFWETEYKENS